MPGFERVTRFEEEGLAEVLRTGILGQICSPDTLCPDYPVDGFGVRVKQNDRIWVYIARMLVNWRIREVDIADLPPDHPFYPSPTWGRGWCYASLPAAVLAAAAWDGAADSEPVGWIKQVGTERVNSEPTPGIRQVSLPTVRMP